MTKKIDALKLANALAAAIDEATQGIATHADLEALEARLTNKMTARFGVMLVSGLGVLFAAMKNWG